MTDCHPLVSIIIPIRNEELYISSCLHSLTAQDYPLGNLDIVIMDGMSTDNTRQIIVEMAVLHPELSIRIIDNPCKFVPAGMNLALRQTRGEIIIRVDGHCMIAPDYVHKCVAHIQKDNVDGVGGPMESIGETFLSKAIAIGISSPFGVGNSAFRTYSGKTMMVDTVPFPAYTRQIIQRAGLYDEELIRNQDDEYNYRIRELGGKILLAEDVLSTYFSRASLTGLWKQYFQYGYWKVRVLQKHSRQMSLRQFVPPAFVLALVVSFFVFSLSFIFHLSSFFLYLSTFIPLLYLLANLTASIWTVIKKVRTTNYSLRSALYSLILLPIVFAILHLSYGLGFLVGLFKFWNRWGDKIGKTPAWSNESAG